MMQLDQALWPAVTLFAWITASGMYRRAPHPLLHPIPISIIGIISLLWLSHTSIEVYNHSLLPFTFLLGPATVALALPLWRAQKQIRRNLLGLVFLSMGSALIAMLLASGMAWALGLSPELAKALWTKSVTTPIAWALAPISGAPSSLAVACVVATGLFGAMWGRKIMDLAHIHKRTARGFALGVSAHGIGTAQALQSHEKKGAWASLGMILTGIWTPLLLPLVLKVWTDIVGG